MIIKINLINLRNKFTNLWLKQIIIFLLLIIWATWLKTSTININRFNNLWLFFILIIRYWLDILLTLCALFFYWTWLGYLGFVFLFYLLALLMLALYFLLLLLFVLYIGFLLRHSIVRLTFWGNGRIILRLNFYGNLLFAFFLYWFSLFALIDIRKYGLISLLTVSLFLWILLINNFICFMFFWFLKHFNHLFTNNYDCPNTQKYEECPQT